MTALHAALAMVEAEHRERAANFVREVLHHAPRKRLLLDWLKVLAEGLPESLEEGGARLESPVYVPEIALVEALENAGFEIHVDEHGRRYVRARAIDPRTRH